MIEKIYSRKRIKLPKMRFRINKIVFFITFMIIILIISVISFVFASYPIFVASCQTAASSKAVNIVNEEVGDVMTNYTYDDLINIEKDEAGNVILMKANTVLINKLVSDIEKNIQERLDNVATTVVYINYGSVSRYKYIKKFRS